MNRYWVFGGFASVILHAVVLGLFLMFGGSSSESPVGDSPSTPPVRGDSPSAVLTPNGPDSQGTVPQVPAGTVPRDSVDNSPEVATTADYQVKSGDNLSRIAKTYGTTIAALADLNGTTVAKLANLKIGQVIRVPVKSE